MTLSKPIYFDNLWDADT